MNKLSSSNAGQSISTVTLSTVSFSTCSHRVFTPDLVSNLITFLLVSCRSWRYFAMHLLAFPHIMASDPSALKMRMEKSASGTGLSPMSTRPSAPTPLCLSLHLTAASEGFGTSCSMVLT